MNKMDELFKNKIENHSLSPSAEAWEKVEQHLEKKSRPIIWWRAAAVVLLATLLGWWAYTSKTSDTPVIQKVASGSEATKTTTNVNAPFVSESTKSNNTPDRASTEPSLAKVVIPQARHEEENQGAMSATATHTEILQATFTTNQVAPQMESATPNIAKVEKPIVLEFTLEPITSDAIATAQAEKRSLKSVLMDLKNGEGNFNFQTLRENLFAFNQKKSKPIETRE